jgi:hypothetical protein
MSNYRDPATLTLEGQERREGQAVLHSSVKDGRHDWRGSFTPDDGAPIQAGGTATLTTKTWTGQVLIQDYRVDGTFGRAILLGQDMPPF